MNDTPRMKAALMVAMEHMTGDVWRVGCQLERELTAANDCNREIIDRNEWLNDKIDAASQRIKRLEEAGDRLQMLIEEQGWWESVPQEMWRKAKDAK